MIKAAAGLQALGTKLETHVLIIQHSLGYNIMYIEDNRYPSHLVGKIGWHGDLQCVAKDDYIRVS